MVVVFVIICSDAARADGTTAIEFAINAAVSLLTAFGSITSFDDFVALRFVRVVRCAGAGDSSLIVLIFEKKTIKLLFYV